MQQHQFTPGQILHYKPRVFAPLQVLPGGLCKVLEIIESDNGECLYRVRFESGLGERVVREEEISQPES